MIYKPQMWRPQAFSQPSCLMSILELLFVQNLTQEDKCAQLGTVNKSK